MHNEDCIEKKLDTKVGNATKWSGIAEIFSKIMSPICNMVLARLLTPEAFGVVATLTVITSFSELFTDAGFQRYIVQHDFKNDDDCIQAANVSFWSNLSLSLIIWLSIVLFAEPLASLVGSPGLGNVLIVFCFSIPLSAFSSIQMALYRKKLDFKTLFKVRIVSVLIPLFVTVPLAFFIRSYWALVLGVLSQNVVNAFLLNYYSVWRPQFVFSFGVLKEMISYSIWILIESISIWLTNYVDVFIVGTLLSQYYLGLYMTSSALVGQILGLITATTTPVLFSALSRLQSKEEEFSSLFFRFQKWVGFFVIPVGFGIFCYSSLTTTVLLGDQWSEAAGFVGLWGLTGALTIVLSHYASEIYKAKGRPKLSVVVQWLHIVVLWPAVIISANYGFQVLYITRSIVRLEIIIVNLGVLYFFVHISPRKMIANISPSLLASIIMMGTTFVFLYYWSSVFGQIIAIIVSVLTYVFVISFFKEEKKMLLLTIHICESHCDRFCEFLERTIKNRK